MFSGARFLTLTGALLLIAGKSSASVSNEKPNLSMFKLRQVDTKELARARFERPIEDLGTGAIHMHESLFVNAFNIKCPAYAHLFELIKRQQAQGKQEVEAANSELLIRQSLVESLAIVVTYDRIFYAEWFRYNLEHNGAQQIGHFIEAAKLLESAAKSSLTSGAWLELIHCLSSGEMAHASRAMDSGSLSSFLEDPTRAQQIAELQKFKSIAVEQPVDSQWTPDGLVSNLRDRYEQIADNKRAPMSADDYREAKRLIEALEGEQMAAFKRQFAVSGNLSDSTNGTEKLVDSTTATPLDRSPVLILDENEREPEVTPISDPGSLSEVKPPQVDVVIPVDDNKMTDEQSEPEQRDDLRNDNEDQSAATSGSFSASKLMILKFIKMRLEQPAAGPFERAPRLSMQLAFDFMTHWSDLGAYQRQLDANRPELNKQAVAFWRNAANEKLASRVRQVISVYTQLTRLIAVIKRDERKWRSMEEFRVPLEQVNELLAKMDPAFDVDDLRRMVAIWQANYTEYNVMDKFINSDSW